VQVGSARGLETGFGPACWRARRRLPRGAGPARIPPQRSVVAYMAVDEGHAERCSGIAVKQVPESAWVYQFWDFEFLQASRLS